MTPASAFRHGQSWCKYFPVTSQSCASPQVLAELLLAERSAAEAHLQVGAAHVSAVMVVVVVYIDVVVLMLMMAVVVVVLQSRSVRVVVVVAVVHA